MDRSRASRPEDPSQPLPRTRSSFGAAHPRPARSPVPTCRSWTAQGAVSRRAPSRHAMIVVWDHTAACRTVDSPHMPIMDGAPPGRPARPPPATPTPEQDHHLGPHSRVPPGHRSQIADHGQVPGRPPSKIRAGTSPARDHRSGPRSRVQPGRRSPLADHGQKGSRLPTSTGAPTTMITVWGHTAGFRPVVGPESLIMGGSGSAAEQDPSRPFPRARSSFGAAHPHPARSPVPTCRS